jgi:membrane protein
VTCEARDELAKNESEGERSNSDQNSDKKSDKNGTKDGVVMSSEDLAHRDSKQKNTAEIK